MSTSADYIRALEDIKTFHDSQTLNNLLDMWCRARYNYHEFDIAAFRKYNWIINNYGMEEKNYCLDSKR